MVWKASDIDLLFPLDYIDLTACDDSGWMNHCHLMLSHPVKSFRDLGGLQKVLCVDY